MPSVSKTRLWKMSKDIERFCADCGLLGPGAIASDSEGGPAQVNQSRLWRHISKSEGMEKGRQEVEL